MRARALRGDGLGAHARGDVGDDDGHDDEEHEGRDVGRIGDREGVDRRQEEEIVAERRRDAGQQRRPQAVAHRDADDRGQEHEIDVLDRRTGLDQLADAESDRDREERDQIGPRIERLRRLRPCAPSSSGAARRRAASPAITWTLILPDRRTRSCTTEPCRISNQRERVDLPMTIWVTLLACAKPITSSAMRAGAAGNGDRLAAEPLGQPQRVGDRGRAPPR